MDGKVSRGSTRCTGNNKDKNPTNTMSIYSKNYGFSLVQDYIDEKSNEIPMGPELLKKLNLNGCIVTADALNTQEKTIKAILKGGADYVLPVKENQKLTYEEIKDYFNDEKILKEIKNKNYLNKCEKEHNGITTREYYMSDEIKKGLKSIGLARNIIEKNGKK